ncbi:MAG: hypothetical protein ACXW4B_09685 [Micavibrio sp.]
MLKYVVEAYSKESYEEAIYRASDKASAFLTGHQSDAHVRIVKLDHSEEMGFHAVLEVTMVPMSVGDNMHIRGIFKETRLAHDLSFRLMLKEEHDHMHHVLEAHFAAARQSVAHQDIPDYILAPLGEADIKNNAIERMNKPHPLPYPHPHIPGTLDDE